MSSSNSPCAACKCLRRKCTPECVFALYFPPDKPEKFACVHKVFGASNVSKILSELNPTYREEAVSSLAYEAETRIQNPIYGCVSLISFLQQRLKNVQEELREANRELSQYMQPNNGEYLNFATYNGQLVMHDPTQHHHQQVLESQEMLRIAYEQQQRQQQLFNNQMMNGGVGVPNMDNLEDGNYNQFEGRFGNNMQVQTPEQLLINRQRSGSEEGPSIGPSC